MAKSGLPKVHRYSMHFKATAVRLSELPGLLIQDVAEALDIHPLMLSRWRKQAREGLIVTKGVLIFFGRFPCFSEFVFMRYDEACRIWLVSCALLFVIKYNFFKGWS